MDCIFSIVGLINWHFIFLFSLTVFIDCDWRLRHPRAVNFICSHGGPEFLKNTGSFPTLWTAAICPACETQRRAICPQGCSKKIRACLGNLPLCPEEGRSGHRGRMVLRVQRVMIPRFLHPFLLSTTAHHTPIAARIHLQVLCWPQEKSRLPFFVLTRNIRLIF